MKKKTLFFLFIVLLLSCNEDQKRVLNTTLTNQTKIYSSKITELSDEEYPDNPDISIRHKKYLTTKMSQIVFKEKTEGVFDMIIIPENTNDDTVLLERINLMGFIPTIPLHCKDDEYLKLISIVNQEWNRNQVRWSDGALEKSTPEKYTVNGLEIDRIDIARNCLNAYLWELFFYTKENGKNKVFYHGWFSFPKELYQKLFKKRNHVDFKEYAEYLENWKDPESQKINLNKLRTIVSQKEVNFIYKNNEMYPLKGERKKKEMCIITPKKYSTMKDFQVDSATFATFSPPGFYNKKQPRKTQLGRFEKIKKIIYRKTKLNDTICDEIEIVFSDKQNRMTHFIFGGIHFKKLPRLSPEECNKGAAFSMGISNHPFYESIEQHESISTKNNPFFSVLLNENGKWLDSHKIGIDGPLLHLDEKNPNLLHLWILSFERHAIIGHCIIKLNEKNS